LLGARHQARVCRTVGGLGNQPARECLGTLGSTDSTKQERLLPRRIAR
jgi:hypothetical protein